MVVLLSFCLIYSLVLSILLTPTLVLNRLQYRPNGPNENIMNISRLAWGQNYISVFHFPWLIYVTHWSLPI